MMKSKIALRLAAGSLLFFALGHTIGHITRHSVKDPKAAAILRQMAENKFDLLGQLRSYDEQYSGMSLNLIVTLLTFVCILWVLSGNAEKNKQFARPMLFILCLCIVCFSITGYVYFFPLPAISCLVAATFTGYAYYKLAESKA